MLVIVGALAQALLDAEGGMLAVEQRVADFLLELFPGWIGGWAWIPPDGIEVYSAIDSPAAASALWLAGFVGGVTIHEHGPKQLFSCQCERRTP